jgi:putative lipoic acid-binding regulatory protein
MLMSGPAISAAQTREAESQVTVVGTVEAVDYTARTVTIRSQQGNVVTVDVPADAKRFDQVKVGSTVTAILLRSRQRAVEARGRGRGRSD